jgi:hypothetical protein
MAEKTFFSLALAILQNPIADFGLELGLDLIGMTRAER